MIFLKRNPSSIFILIGILLSVFGYAQVPNPYIPTIISASPNASSLMKFTDVPVSTYTGTADLTVPIYNIQARGISVPVDLSYHTGGIKVKEEAGWVGLGWALNAGGMISRTIMDKDDFNGQYLNEPVPEITSNVQAQSLHPGMSYLGAYGYDFFCDYNVNTDSGIVSFANALQSPTPPFDMEADAFSYSFPGHSGKFVITRTGKVLLQKQENIKIQYATTGSSFTITDDQGNKFLFSDKEYTEGSDSYTQKVSSWMLSKITTQLNDSVKFNYVQDGSWTTLPADIFQTYRLGCPTNTFGAGSEGSSSVQRSPDSYLNLTLQSIDFSNGQLQFIFDGNRVDLQNGKKLNNVKIYSKNSSGLLTYVKEHDFYYSYFNSDIGSTPIQEYQRLRLDSVKEISSNASIPPYSFTYNYSINRQFSGKHTYAVDHWGYFNGKGGNSTFIPTFNALYNPGVNSSYYVSIAGANRDPDPVYIQCFSLQQIKYPTGGYTTLEYEGNDYDIQSSTTGPPDFPQASLIDTFVSFHINTRGSSSGSIDMSNMYGAIAGSPSSNATLSVTFRDNNNNGLAPYRNTQNQIYFNFFGTNIDISNTNVTCPVGTPICTTNAIDLFMTQATTQPWTAYISPSVGSDFEEIDIMITWQELLTAHTNSPTLPAGGLRVKTITDYNADNTITKKRRYEYSYMQDRLGTGTPIQYSSGRLMSSPSYARYEPMTINQNENCESLTLTSSSNTSVTSAISGNIVGYDTVKEYVIDPVSGNDIGKTTYAYSNQSDVTPSFIGFRLPGLLNFGNNLNGTLLSKITYSNNGVAYTPISEVDNFYHKANHTQYFSLKYAYWRTTSGFSSNCPGGTCVPNEFLGEFYPSVISERILLDSTKETLFDQLDNTKYVLSKKYNYYDNPIHYQLTRATSTDSKGNIHMSVIKYPQDYIPTGLTVTNNTILDSMINRNMVSEVIEKRDSLFYNGATTNGKVIDAQLSKYKLITSNSIAVDKQYRFDQTGPVSDFQGFSITGNVTAQDSRYRQLISFDNYDNVNNIAQYTAVDQTPVSVLWDYKNVYPIAQVKNAVLADIAFTSFEADGSGSWTIPSAVRDSINFITGTKSYNLSSGAISKSGLTSGKIYMLSYWSKNGSYTLTGGTVSSKTGRVVNGWTYYEQTVTATATSFSISGTGNIDELRLYPKGALMTSYTYNPLVGVTTMNDPNSEITYYEYDALTRLKNIKDYQGNIIKNFQYNYANNCDNCYLPMQTFAGTNTLSYPVGVFNVSGQLLGNATNQAQYISLWNANTADQQIGTLAVGADSMHFKITLNAAKVAPSSVTGCRYYQYDLAYTQIDGIRNANGAYVDFGDGTGMRLGMSNSDSTSMTIAPNTVKKTILEGTPVADYFVYWIHNYTDNSLKTITIYHNDGNEFAGLDNGFNPATSLTLVKNFRGYCPQNMITFMASCYQQASATSFANIVNWNSINTVLTFGLNPGDQGITPIKNVSYAQDFMANNKGLKLAYTAWSVDAVSDSTFKFSRFKSDWNTYFTALAGIILNDDNWNREDLSTLLQLNYIKLFASLKNPTAPIPSSVIDNIINQIASGSGQTVSNGSIFIYSRGGTRTSASDASVTFLKSKGWTLSVNNVTL